MKIKKSSDCGNSPKNKIVQDAVIAILEGNLEANWVHGGQELVGQIVELKIYHVVSHGKIGVVNGELKTKSGQKQKPTRNFCFVVEFSGASLKSVERIYSYE